MEEICSNCSFELTVVCYNLVEFSICGGTAILIFCSRGLGWYAATWTTCGSDFSSLERLLVAGASRRFVGAAVV